MSSKDYTGISSLLPSLLFLIALLPTSTVAQSSTPGLTSEATLSTQTSLSRTEPPLSMRTTFTSSTIARNNTYSPSTSTSTSTSAPPSNEVFPVIHPDVRQGVFQYYWLILAIFGVAIAIFLWWAGRRRKRRKEQMRLSGQNALARDMEGWINTRRWFHGAWRPNQTRAFVRREEGLNEHGEAPPPYQASADSIVAQGLQQDPASGLSVPLRTLSREDVDGGHPPEYRETMSRGGISTIRPDTANSRTAQSGPSGSSPRSSTGNLVQNHDVP